MVEIFGEAEPRDREILEMAVPENARCGVAKGNMASFIALVRIWLSRGLLEDIAAEPAPLVFRTKPYTDYRNKQIRVYFLCLEIDCSRFAVCVEDVT